MAPPSSAGQVYRRLLGYARPHRGMFLIGVVGMALFAATGRGFAFLVQKFVDLAASSTKRPQRVVAGAARGAVAVPVARRRRLHVGVYFPGYVSRQIIKAHARATCFASTCIFPRSTTTASPPARCCPG